MSQKTKTKTQPKQHPPHADPPVAKPLPASAVEQPIVYSDLYKKVAALLEDRGDLTVLYTPSIRTSPMIIKRDGKTERYPSSSSKERVFVKRLDGRKYELFHKGAVYEAVYKQHKRYSCLHGQTIDKLITYIVADG